MWCREQPWCRVEKWQEQKMDIENHFLNWKEAWMENGDLTTKCPIVKSYIEEQKTRMYQTKGDYNNEDPRLAATNSDDLGRH